MKWLLVAIVRVYRALIRPRVHRTCLFRESCSAHVLRNARDNGAREAIRAFRRRFRACRSGYRWLGSREDRTSGLLLADGTVLAREDASEQVLDGTI